MSFDSGVTSGDSVFRAVCHLDRSTIRVLSRQCGAVRLEPAHVLRHTFGTTLVRAGTDLVTVAELLGHSRVETVRIYSRPAEADKIRAWGT